MINKKTKPEFLGPEEQQPDINAVYDKLKKNFDDEAAKVKFDYYSPNFADNEITFAHRTLPKLEIQSKKKATTKKFYSNKLIVNESIYIHERNELSYPDSTTYEFKKLTIPKPMGMKQESILSERSKRLVNLFKRAEMEAERSKQKSKKKQSFNSPNNLETQLLQKKNPTYKPKNQEKNLEILKAARERKQRLSLPQVRSKSNMLVNSTDMEAQTINSPLKGEKYKSIETPKPKQKVIHMRSRPNMKPASLTPYQGMKFAKKATFNWKAADFSLHRVSKHEFTTLMQHYLKIGEVKGISSGSYRAFVGAGNNCHLIKKVLKDRGHWTFTQNIDEDVHFVWTQEKCCRFINKMEDGQKLQYDLKNRTQDEIQQEVENFIKIKMNEFISGCQKLLTEENFLRLMTQIRKKFIEGRNINWYQRIAHLTTNVYSRIRYHFSEVLLQSSKIKLHNHIQNGSKIGNKKELFHQMRQYAELFGEDLNSLLPTTVHIKDEPEEVLEAIPTGPWIVKPGEETNRGFGISIHTTSESLLSELSKKRKHRDGAQFTYIVQQYLEPFLYYNRKFDIRVWVLWSGRQMWWYRQGYARTCSKQYTLKNTNKFIHLTNDAVQCLGEDFGKFEPANKISYNQLSKYVEMQLGVGKFASIESEMKRIAKKVFKMANLVMDPNLKQFSFQLFGLDFLIDRSGRPWLIQCNTNPSLEINCSLLSRIIPNMIQNMVSLAIDPYFPTPEKKQAKESPIWNQQSFKFQLLYDGNQDQEVFGKTLIIEDLLLPSEQ